MESKRERRYLVEVTALTLGLHTHLIQIPNQKIKIQKARATAISRPRPAFAHN